MRVLTTGFNFSQDGPGNRLVIHLQGCNFRCPWCSNPESMSLDGACREMTVDEVVTLAQRSRAMFFSGGGVTFTGGEATLQFDELLDCCRRLRELDINTALETNASHPKLPVLAQHIDHLMMDFKLADPQAHKHFTENDGKLVRENIQKLTAMRPVSVRIPLINGINTDPLPFVAFFDTCNKENLQVELLPYHEYGKDKWTKPYTITNGFVTQEQIASFLDALHAHGIRTTHT